MEAAGRTSVLFTLKEAAVLSRLPEEKLRREIERRVITPRGVSVGSAHRLVFVASEILYFAMLNSFIGVVELAPTARKEVWRLLGNPSFIGHLDDDRRGAKTAADRRRNAWVTALDRAWAKRISAAFTVNWHSLIDDVASRIDVYRAGLSRIHEDEDILGGEPVFRGTRLAVRHIGGMRANGEPMERIVEDYPELTAADVEFAQMYAQAHPIVGRPSSRAATA